MRCKTVFSLLFLLAMAGCDQVGSPYGGRSCGSGVNTLIGAGAGAATGGLLANSLSGRWNRGGNTALGVIGGGLVGAVVGSATEPPCPTPEYGTPIYVSPPPVYYAPPSVIYAAPEPPYGYPYTP
jgi:hypothetical protein